MHVTGAEIMLLIPLSLSLAFLFWVIWELEKQIRKERRISHHH